MHSRRGFFTDALPIFDGLGEPPWPLFGASLEQLFDHFLLMAAAGRLYPFTAVLHLVSLVQQQRRVPAIVYDKLRPFAARMRQSRQRKIPVFLERFAFE